MGRTAPASASAPETSDTAIIRVIAVSLVLPEAGRSIATGACAGRAALATTPAVTDSARRPDLRAASPPHPHLAPASPTAAVAGSPCVTVESRRQRSAAHTCSPIRTRQNRRHHFYLLHRLLHEELRSMRECRRLSQSKQSGNTSLWRREASSIPTVTELARNGDSNSRVESAKHRSFLTSSHCCCKESAVPHEV